MKNLLSITVLFAAAGAVFAQSQDSTPPDPGYIPSTDVGRTEMDRKMQEEAEAKQAQLEANAQAEAEREQDQQNRLALIQAQADAQANAQIKVDQARAQTQADAEYQRSVARAMAEYPDSANADSALGRAISNRFTNMPSDDPLWQNPDRAEVVATQEAEKLGIRGVSEGSASTASSAQDQSPHVEVGTAFFVTTNGYLLTDFHVVKDANNIQIRDRSGLRPAALVARDPINDIAILKVAGPSKCLPIGDSGAVSLGEDVFTIGFPNPDVQGLSPKLTRGQISSLAGLQDDPRMYQISAPVQPGNSGGCLVDANGNVVGIISSQLDAVAMASSTGSVPQNVNYALKISYAKLLLGGLADASGSMATPGNAPVPFDKGAAAAQDSTVMVIAQ